MPVMSISAHPETSQVAWKPPRKLHILELPAETLDAIFLNTGPSELLNLCLVSKDFRALAVAQLYRNFSHTFNDFEDRYGHVLLDRLAAILETLVTSDYNYAAHIKHVRMDTAYGGEAGERACREYSYEYSCGKFLNTLLLAALKRVDALETFHWNIRVELSDSVFKILHSMNSLQHVHIRLHSGSTPYTQSSQFSFPVPPPPAIPPPSHPVHHPNHAPPPAFISYNSNAVPLPMSNAIKPSKRAPVPRSQDRNNITFSGFSTLSTLAILDMDSLDYIPEIAECIRNSSGTLKELKLSFSTALALKSRKKTVQVSDSETGQDDDDIFEDDGDLPHPHQPVMIQSPPLFGPGNVSSEADVRKERLAQEKALGKMFGLEKEDPKTNKFEKIAEEAIAKAERDAQAVLRDSAKDDADKVFVKNLKSIMGTLVQETSASGKNSKAQRMLEKIDKAANEYLKGKEQAGASPKKQKHALPLTKKYSLKPKHGPPNPHHPHGPHYPPPVAPNGLHYMPSTASSSADVMDPFDFDSFLDINQTPAYHPSGLYSYPPGPSKKKIPYSKPKKIVIKSKDGTTHTVYPNPPHHNDYLNVKSFKPAPPSKLKGKPALSTQSSSLSSASGLGWDDPYSDPTTQEAAASGAKAPKEEFDDDIDIEHPDEVEDDDNEDQESIDTPESPTENHSRDDEEEMDESSSSTPIPHSKTNGFISEPLEPEHSPKTRKVDKGKGVDKGSPPPRVDDFQEETDGKMSIDQAIQEYVRLNHGVPLEKLSIHLIPVRPSILCRAIDICSLQSISLLNVGPQRTLWAMLTKLQETTPLRLRSIFTDNVTPSFLVFLNGLKGPLEELFMLERFRRNKVEPFAPKTSVGIEDIRKQVLKKHMPTLKRLMIRNEDDQSWALNRESVRVLTRWGKELRELCISLGPAPFHLLMQNLSSLTSLRALQIISMNSDGCAGILRELRLCVIDNVSHYPTLPLEYIALSNIAQGNMNPQVTQIIRKESTKKESKKGDGQGEDSSDEEDIYLNVETIDHLRLRDAVDVKIWDKDILGGRL